MDIGRPRTMAMQFNIYEHIRCHSEVIRGFFLDRSIAKLASFCRLVVIGLRSHGYHSEGWLEGVAMQFAYKIGWGKHSIHQEEELLMFYNCFWLGDSMVWAVAW